MIQDKTVIQRILDYENAAHSTESMFDILMLDFCIASIKLQIPMALDRGVFYSDGSAQSSFANVLFYGNESSLFAMEIMVFVLIAGCWGNYLVGMLTVGAISRVSTNCVQCIVVSDFLQLSFILSSVFR